MSLLPQVRFSFPKRGPVKFSVHYMEVLRLCVHSSSHLSLSWHLDRQEITERVQTITAAQ